MEKRYSKWRKLDNAALAFPLVTGKNDTRVFRFYCELKEPVQPEILQSALDQTMEKYPLFQAVLRKGLFWFYLERRDIRPLAAEEKKPPCSRLYIPDKKSLLFEVTYYENRINFEVFHALTDGTGAMNFLLELVQNYLILAHSDDGIPRIPEKEEITPGDQEEDSFSQYYSSETQGKKKKNPPAVRLKGEKLPHDDMQILEISIPVKEILAKARSYGASITAFLSAVLICAIHEEIPRSRQKKPVTLMVPVNLRNFFPSQSMGNFFGWIEVGYTFSEKSTFRDVLDEVKKQFETELVKEKIAEHMSGYVRLEKNPLIRAVPLEVKRYFLMLGAELGSRSITSVYSNVGVIRLPEEYRNYIERFGLFCQHRRHAALFLLLWGGTSSRPYLQDPGRQHPEKFPQDTGKGRDPLQGGKKRLSRVRKRIQPGKQEAGTGIYFSLRRSGGDLRNDQLHDSGYPELVLVCRRGMSVRLACSDGGLYEAEEYPEK